MKKLTYILAFSVLAAGISAQNKKGNTTGGKNTTTGLEITSEKELTGFLLNKFSYAEQSNYYDLGEALVNPDLVTSLKLARQGLTEIPKELSKFKNLVELDLSDNEIGDFSSKLNELSNLKILNLSGNNLTTIPADICSLKNLFSLNLSANKIASGSLSCANKLERLFLNNNLMTQLPDGVTDLKGLKSLYLHSNQLTTLDEKLLRLTELEVLTAQFNKIIEEPKVFEHNGIINYAFYPQAVNAKYLYKYMGGSRGSLSSVSGGGGEGSSEGDASSFNTFSTNEVVVNEKYNIKSVKANNDFWKIKVGDHDYRRYSKFRLYVVIPVALALPFTAILPPLHWCLSKKHRNNMRMTTVYYMQKKVDKIADKTPTVRNYKRVESLNKVIVKRYARYLRSKGLKAQ